MDQLDSSALYAQVENILGQVVHAEMVLPQWHRRLDAAVLHPVWGFAILLMILLLVFKPFIRGQRH